MARSPLLGRRIHITGSIAADPAIAAPADVEAARRLVQLLVPELVRRGANLLIPVDREPTRADGQPICFDWLVWEALHGSIASRAAGAPAPLAIAVQHYKSEDQVPANKAALWDALRASPLVRIENAAH
jgi:TIR- and PNP-associating SLOG family